MKKKRSLRFYPRSDSGNAELFAVLYRDTVRFDHKQGRWLLWDEGRWTEDKQEKVRGMMKQAARRRHELVLNYSADNEERIRQIKWALESESRYAIDAALELAKSEPNVSDDGEKWDADPMLFGVGNGIVDLATGQFRAAAQEDFVTKFSPVAFDANAKCPRFEQFLEEIFDGDQQRIQYIQRVVGYTLTGSVEEHCLFACYGSGRNGKSTLLEVLFYIMGDYGVDLPFSTLETKHQIGEGANLPGARFAKAVEIREGRRLDEARVKSWTGGDTISVRPLYRNTFSFSPTHKLWLAFNHKPVVADNSPAIWNRIHLIPFERKFEKHGADKKLLATLKAEAPGILNWAIQGCLAWQSEGLKVPAAVEQATRQYEQDSDPIGPFLAECCEHGPEFQVPKSELWKSYQASCSEPMSQKAFAERMRSRGFGERRTGSTRSWTGLRLKPVVPESDKSDGSDTNFGNFSSRNSYRNFPKDVSQPVIVSHPLMPGRFQSNPQGEQ